MGAVGSQEVIGSIPACAGEPRRTPPRIATDRVYPRVCGGTPRYRAQLLPDPGLSPRVRGNRRLPLAGSRSSGSIPACAGEPGRNAPWPNRSPVYPRVCGGTRVSARPDLSPQGLSPRVRGNHAVPAVQFDRHGSIPACAGEPRPSCSSSGLLRVYPRVCGGTSPHPPDPRPHKGLSPRVRGNHRQATGRRCLGGSIPACAGEPSATWCCCWHPWVYPRVCGGTATERQENEAVEGLSPRVRGNRSRCI